MPKYVLRRLLLLIPTLIGMSMLIFLMLRLLPGDIVDIIAGTDAQADSAAKERLREAMGLADPIPVQYVKWMWNLLQGDPGNSLRSGKPVGELLWRAIPVTMELAFLAMLMATVVAIPLGVISAVKRDTALDFGARVTGLVGLSLPSFWIATLALLFTSKVVRVGAADPVHLAGRRSLGQSETDGVAGVRGRDPVDGDRDADDPDDDAGGAEPGLRADGAGEGVAG